MKRIFLKRVMIAGAVALFAVPSVFAQDSNKEKSKEKEKEKKEVQQIIITRTGDVDEKTVVEINGDKVIVNGKEVKEGANGDVKVDVNKIRDVTAYRMPMPPRAPRAQSFNFENNDGFSLFSEDENRAMLGVVTEGDDKGAKITSVGKESAAEKAGLKEGDIITKIDDAKIEDQEDVAEAIRKHKPGEKTTLTILRDGKEQKITAELGKWKGIRMNADNFHFEMPELPNFRTPYAFGPNSPRLGLSIQDTEDGKGVKVLDVDEDSNAAKAGLKEEDVITHVNDEAVNSADEVSRKVRASRDKASVQFKVLRNGKSQNIEVKVPRKLKTADL